MRQGTIIAIKTNVMSGELIGVVIKGTKQFNGKVVKVTKQQLQDILSKMPDAIDNCALRDGELEFTDGTQKRYTDLNELGSGSTPLVVLNKLKYKDTSTYELCDYKGETVLVDEELAAVYLKKFGIAKRQVKITWCYTH